MQPENILTYIPQRQPFVMVDELLHRDETSTLTAFKVRDDNFLVTNGEFTEAGLMENIAQTAAARAGYLAVKQNEQVKPGYIGSVRNFEVLELPKINDNIFTEVKTIDQVFDVTIISGTVKCNGVLMAKCEMNIFIGK